ncbi:hypothetical protein [Alicyclobacillus sp. ALC3]|uniref:hypothetical protein n=1 Tax=Alicyclobacillus sp. ALC3 TaxID=2796143 RepID=UPI002378D75F|nr:hypothetical protein [Alicyclobacillus sp. ALC3]WDL99756.1 hypothetical protein JC200_23575 [Alicyclobacillus sp. ALC3]
MVDKSKIGWTDGRRLGVLKTAAKRLGVPFEMYIEKLNQGLKYCWKCQQWMARGEFNADKSKSDGLKAVCRICARKTGRESYVPRSRKRRGFIAKVRNGDKLQARRRVNYLVEQGLIPHPDDLPCIDCGDELFIGEYRHEYDHARGYDGENQLYVEPVCSRCHHAREEARRNGQSA